MVILESDKELLNPVWKLCKYLIHAYLIHAQINSRHHSKTLLHVCHWNNVCTSNYNGNRFSLTFRIWRKSLSWNKYCNCWTFSAKRVLSRCNLIGYIICLPGNLHYNKSERLVTCLISWDDIQLMCRGINPEVIHRQN